MWIFPPLHPARVWGCRIVFHPWTHRFILVLIFFSCIVVALDRPGLSTDAQYALASTASVTNFLFLVEMFLKILGLNFQVYIRSGFKKYLTQRQCRQVNHCNKQHHTEPQCNTLHYTAKHCNTLSGVHSLRV
jgi:hypothetical protein